MEPALKIPLPKEELQDIVEKTKDYCLLNGIGLRRKDNYDRDCLHFAPFTLLPSPFPKSEFKLALELQPVLNDLMHRVAHDREFLVKTLSKTIQVDDFTKRLFDIYNTVWEEGINQPISLGLFRSDYFYCCCSNAVKQVEFNTIASSFGGTTRNVVKLHHYVLGELKRPDLLERVPENKALEGLCSAMIKSKYLYDGGMNSVIMFIVEDVTYNICDQKFHELKIREMDPHVHVIRRTLTQVHEQGRLEGPDKRLFVGEHEVAVIYFRCGYAPDQYHDGGKEWDARLLMERSRAIKSPSIQYHLAGTKKVQQELAVPGMLEKFFPESDSRTKKIRGIFTGLYSVDQNEEGDKNFEMALAHPEKFVLKPQREGGGNNVYGEDIKPFLEGIRNSDERNAYILMERIRPPISKNYAVRPGFKEATYVDTVSELGVFGYIIGDDKGRIVDSRTVGHMLRTKLADVNEGGVAAGLGMLDSVFLVGGDSDRDGCCDDLGICDDKVNEEKCCVDTI